MATACRLGLPKLTLPGAGAMTPAIVSQEHGLVALLDAMHVVSLIVYLLYLLMLFISYLWRTVILAHRVESMVASSVAPVVEWSVCECSRTV
jgi:hypothetical protein